MNGGDIDLYSSPFELINRASDAIENVIIIWYYPQSWSPSSIHHCDTFLQRDKPLSGFALGLPVSCIVGMCVVYWFTFPRFQWRFGI